MNQADFDGLSPDGKRRIAKGITDLDNAIVAHHRRNPEIVDRPTPASDEKKLRKLFNTYGGTIVMLQLEEDDSVRDKKLDKLETQFVKRILQLRAAAVQAESRKLLERLKQGLPMQQECDYHGGGEEGCPGCSASDEHNNTLKTVTALLDSEQQKLGGKS